MIPVQLPPLHVDGPDLKDPVGHVVHLRGCNLGSWLVTENWMWDQNEFQGAPRDQYELVATLTRRFGSDEAERLLDLYHRSWITDRDFEIIKSFRFNCVRLPFQYRDLESDDAPYKLKKRAFVWLDRAVELGRKHGIYVILDMHGAEGGQSKEDHTGRRDQNKLWTSTENQNRLAWLWGQIARRYKNEPTVVAYDAFNEPYGAELEQIKPVFDKCYASIRKIDSEKLIYAEGRYDTFDNYGDPKVNGWHNVGFQMHYYPGIFDGGAHNVKHLLDHLDWMKSSLAPKVKALGVPFLIGEMSIVYNSSGGAAMTRRWFDQDEALGWATTMWSYKVLNRAADQKDGSWAMVYNAKPFESVDFVTAPKSAIEGFFRGQATLSYVVRDDLRKAMASKTFQQPIYDLSGMAGRQTAPQDLITPWQTSDIGDAKKGGQEASGDKVTLFGAGTDIWGRSDSFRFLFQTGSATEVTATVQSIEDLGQYCKAGVMIRNGANPDTAFAMLSVFPNGGLQLTTRDRAGTDAKGSDSVIAKFPVKLRLTVRDGVASASYMENGSTAWKPFQDSKIDLPTEGRLAGVVACSHDPSQLIKVVYGGISVK